MRFMGPPNIWMRERLRVERGLRRILRKLQQGLRLASGNVLRPELPVRQVKIWAVQQVERFSAEFQVQPLGNRSEFCQPQIEGSISGTSNNASGGISELAKRLELERIHIEPFVRSLWPGIGITSQVGAVAECPSFTLVAGQKR